MHLVAAVKKRPITMLALASLSIFCFWMAFVLHRYVPHYSSQRLVSFEGPFAVFGVETWAYLYLFTGIATVVRMLAVREHYSSWDVVVHTVTTFPVLIWCVTFILGPPGVGQPTYLFVLIWVAVIPLLTPLIEISRREALRGIFLSSATIGRWERETRPPAEDMPADD